MIACLEPFISSVSSHRNNLTAIILSLYHCEIYDFGISTTVFWGLVSVCLSFLSVLLVGYNMWLLHFYYYFTDRYFSPLSHEFSKKLPDMCFFDKLWQGCLSILLMPSIRGPLCLFPIVMLTQLYS